MGRGFCPSTYACRGFTRTLATVLFIVVSLVIAFSVSVVTATVVEERLSCTGLEVDPVNQEPIEPVCEYWEISTLNETTEGSWFRTIGGESTEWAYRLALYGENIYATGFALWAYTAEEFKQDLQCKVFFFTHPLRSPSPEA